MSFHSIQLNDAVAPISNARKAGTDLIEVVVAGIQIDDRASCYNLKEHDQLQKSIRPREAGEGRGHLPQEHLPRLPLQLWPRAAHGQEHGQHVEWHLQRLHRRQGEKRVRSVQAQIQIQAVSLLQEGDAPAQIPRPGRGRSLPPLLETREAPLAALHA